MLVTIANSRMDIGITGSVLAIAYSHLDIGITGSEGNSMWVQWEPLLTGASFSKKLKVLTTTSGGLGSPNSCAWLSVCDRCRGTKLRDHGFEKQPNVRL